MLIVRSDGARLFHGARGRHAPVLNCTPDETGFDAFRRYLKRSAPPPIHLLVDVVEEDFQRETIPHVLGRARRTVAAKKCARLFHGTPYVSAKREGRLRDGRRDDCVLFSAIVRPERLEPWLDALRGQKVAGVHSLPIVSARLLPLLRADAGTVLLVTESGERGLRQTCFEDGRVAMSRLAPVAPVESNERVQSIMEEVDRFVRHLDRTGRRSEELRIHVVADTHRLAAIRKAARPGAIADGLVDTVELERLLGRRVRSDGNPATCGAGAACDRLLVHLALNGRLPNHYAPAADLAVHRSTQAARTITAAGISILLAGTAWGGAAWHRSGEVAATTEALIREARALEERYTAERPKDMGTSLRDLRLAVETAQRLEAVRVRALPILRPVSEVLSGSPVLQLDSLEWFEASERDGWPDPQGENGRNAQFRIVHLRGRVEPFDGHHRAAAEEVFRFADGLEALPRLSDVEVLDVPQHPGWGELQHRRTAGFEIRMLVDAVDETERPWSRLKLPLAALSVTVLVGGGSAGAGWWYERGAAERLNGAESRIVAARRRYSVLDDERQQWRHFGSWYRRLSARGRIGEEQSAQWTEAVRTAASGVPSASHRLGMPLVAENDGGVEVRATDMSLELEIRHEEELPEFLAALEDEARGLFTITGCRLVRSGTGEADARRLTALSASCRLRWHNVSLSGVEPGWPLGDAIGAADDASAGLAAAEPAAGAAPRGALGRLFSTPEERAKAEAAATPATGEEHDAPNPGEPRIPSPASPRGSRWVDVNGLVVRSGQSVSAWIDGRRVDYRPGPSDRTTRPGHYPPEVRVEAGGRRIAVLPGQRFDPATGTIADSVRRDAFRLGHARSLRRSSRATLVDSSPSGKN